MTKRRAVIGVMGQGEGASSEDLRAAEELGRRVAERGWVLLTGGREAGVMAAANRGAKSVPGSVTLGVLPWRGESDGAVCADVDIAIFTGMGEARNVINVLSSDVVVACGTSSAGTASEVALALKTQRPVILLAPTLVAAAYFASLDAQLPIATSPEQAIELIAGSLSSQARAAMM